MLSAQYIFLLVIGICCVCCLWKTGSFSLSTSSVHEKASIQLDLTVPRSSLATLSSNRFFKKPKKFGEKNRGKFRDNLSKYMLRLYHRRPDADIVRAIQPTRISGPIHDGGRILEFSIPSVNPEEILEMAELLGTVGTIFRVRTMDGEQRKKGFPIETSALKSRKDELWRAFNVTSAVASRNSEKVRLHVQGRLRYHSNGEEPILLLNYSKTKKRIRRSADRDDQEEITSRWEEGGMRRRRRNGCRRRSLYVDFALIAYDEWVVAPPGYEAYQCSGKCLYPLGDHLSPTKHAIVQTLVHGALQSTESFERNKPVGRACCVPTRLAPTSLLYLDASGTLTYQYGYEDMVVVECGCR